MPTGSVGETPSPVQVSPTSVPTQVEVVATPVATSTQNTGNPDQPEVVAVVIDRLRSRLGVASAEIGLVSAEQEQWPDGCLGAAERVKCARRLSLKGTE